MFILFVLVLYIHVIACFLFFMLRQSKLLSSVDPIWSPASEFGDLDSGSIWKYEEVYDMYDGTDNGKNDFSFLLYQYLTSMYQACLTFALVEINPRTVLQIMYCFVVFIVNAMINAVLFGLLVEQSEVLGKAQNEYQERVDRANTTLHDL